MEKTIKKQALIIILFIIIMIIVFTVYQYQVVKKARPIREAIDFQELIKKVTAPSNAKPIEVSKELIQKMTPPKNAKSIEIPQDLIKKTTAPK
jgi:predicted negative regulator of RcsB-dependent stress response